MSVMSLGPITFKLIDMCKWLFGPPCANDLRPKFDGSNRPRQWNLFLHQCLDLVFGEQSSARFAALTCVPHLGDEVLALINKNTCNSNDDDNNTNIEIRKKKGSCVSADMPDVNWKAFVKCPNIRSGWWLLVLQTQVWQYRTTVFSVDVFSLLRFFTCTSCSNPQKLSCNSFL